MKYISVNLTHTPVLLNLTSLPYLSYKYQSILVWFKSNLLINILVKSMLEGMYGSTRSKLTPLLLLGTGIALFPLDGVTETGGSMCLFEWKWFLSLLICFLFDIIFHFIAPKILRPRQQHHQGWHVQTTNKQTGQRQNLPLSPF